ncbi:THAP domain-containing protein 1-like [Sipha flava]|uniref:THAP domain-containing protein 1-like n=1 Tax=Sipha flava TaxID=143950 RepID=A0A8B8G2C9_9HEMI|nr:THAP domain-containing protein 1-like [Sipha flava]
MPYSCVAYGCANRASPEQSTQFFRFPHSNEELMKKWIEAIKRKHFKLSQYSRICSDHFTNDDFQILPNANRLLLRLDTTVTDIHECWSLRPT